MGLLGTRRPTCSTTQLSPVLEMRFLFVIHRHKATLNRLVRRKEAEMARKRSKVPGTPGVALQNGRGVLSLSDVMVTWVVSRTNAENLKPLQAVL
jgi:hypothetical protein